MFESTHYLSKFVYWKHLSISSILFKVLVLSKTFQEYSVSQSQLVVLGVLHKSLEKGAIVMLVEWGV